MKSLSHPLPATDLAPDTLLEEYRTRLRKESDHQEGETTEPLEDESDSLLLELYQALLMDLMRSQAHKTADETAWLQAIYIFGHNFDRDLSGHGTHTAGQNEELSIFEDPDWLLRQ